MQWMRSARLRSLALVALTGAGLGVSHVDKAFAGPGPRRAAMLAAGVDMTPVGTAKQVERAKQARPERP